jgi:endo-1,3-1,4-beta-glycanase ExoK
MLLALVASPASANDDSDVGQAFIDRFAEFERSRWVVSDGWSNGEWTANDWRRSQVRLRESGGIDLVLARSRSRGAKPFSSGEVQSGDEYRYGYFEVQMRAARGSGLVSGFFTYTRPDGEHTWDEIDIEILGRNTRRIQLTYFQGGQRQAVTLPLRFDAAARMHTYAFEWRPTHIRWYVDGRLLHEVRGEGLAIPQRQQRLYLHLWNSSTLTDWLGPISRSRGPWTMRVGCVAHAPRFSGRPLCAAPVRSARRA